jgi:indole-3-glycerol phosphate synthase
MDALVEVHTQDELRRAQNCGASIIGVNNRNLHTFNVSLETSETLVQHATPDLVLISESGLNNAADLKHLAQRGYHGFLIGENLMRAERPEEALRNLIQEAS